MEIDRPAPGEELNRGPVTPPRAAASVILLREGAQPFEVLLVQRNPEARFMGGAWVFPGGAVDREEGTGQQAVRAAAVRELFEEAGIELQEPADLIPFSRWITPAQVKIRFDTWFFLALAGEAPAPRVDGHEIVAWRWYPPAQALTAAEQGELFLVFPTVKHLEQLARFESVDELVQCARSQEIVAVEPRVVNAGSGEEARIVLPGEPGY